MPLQNVTLETMLCIITEFNTKKKRLLLYLLNHKGLLDWQAYLFLNKILTHFL